MTDLLKEMKKYGGGVKENDMAERLTEKDKYGNNAIFQKKDKFTIAKDKNNDIRVYGKAIDKLAQLEDIMEKYGIESVELLEHIIKKGMVINSVIEDFAKEEYDKIKQDRDTWQKACELACDVLRDINYKIYNEDRIDFENTFYQQAKKEGDTI